MNKKSIIIIVSILVIGLIVLGLYGTFATSSTATSNDNTYSITLTGDTNEVVVPAGSSKTVIYQVTNTNNGTVQYGIAYSGDNISAKVYDNSEDDATGTIEYGETKFVKLILSNSGTTDSTASVKAVLGYENGGSLDSVVPSEHELVSKLYVTGTAVEQITKLYLSNNPTEIINYQSDEKTEQARYYYSYMDEDKTWGLMNDGLKIDTTQNETTTGLAKVVTDTTKLTSGEEGNIRYFGPSESVKNYIYFNCDDYSNQTESTCEKWRIIGIVDGKVKIIKEDSIGNLAWDAPKNEGADTLNVNNWENASLQLFLNGLYYNRGTTTTHTYYSGSSGSTETPLNLVDIGITEATRNNNLISESTWYLGGYYSPSGLYPNDIYTHERTNKVGTTILSGNPYTINANIGLMYASDYGYGTDLTKCSKNINNYDTVSACTTNNWLFNSAIQWLITPPSSNSANAWGVYSTGCVGTVSAVYYAKGGVRPVLYLNSELVIESGHEGTSGDPYRISLS